MPNMRAIWFALALLLALAGCASLSQPRPKPPTLDEIVEMSKSGVAADEIIRKLGESDAVYALSASDVVRLHQRGVPEAVLDYMQRAYIEDVRDEEALRAYHRYGWYYDPWPYYRYRPFRPRPYWW
jgi:hypothetical protein